jgi:aromatic ring-cleaving dioxygenase
MTTSAFNSQIRPQNFPHHFDAHIYFTHDQQKEIEELREYLVSFYTGKDVFVGNVINREVGPHPLPMLECNFSRAMFTDVVLFLMGNRKQFNVLIHPISGDDIYDHSQGAMWLGESLALKMERLS